MSFFNLRLLGIGLGLTMGLLVGSHLALAADPLGLSGEQAIAQSEQKVASPNPVALSSDWFEYFSKSTGKTLTQHGEQMVQQLAKIKEGLDPASPSYTLIEQVQAQITRYVHVSNADNGASSPAFIPPESLHLIKALSLARTLDLLGSEAGLTKLEIEQKQEQNKALREKLTKLRVDYQSLTSSDPARLKVGLEIMRTQLADASDRKLLNQRMQQQEEKTDQITAIKDFLANQAISQLAFSTEVEQTWSQEKRELQARQAKINQSSEIASLSEAQTNLSRINQLSRETQLAFLNAQAALITEGLAFNHDLADQTKASLTRSLQRLDALASKSEVWQEDLARWRGDLALQRNLIRTIGRDSGMSEAGATMALPSVNKTELLKQVGTIQDYLDQLNTSIAQIAVLSQLESRWINAHQGLWKRWLGEIGQQLSGWRNNLGAFISESLFEINDTPVTVVGLLRVLFILIAAWWLSKGMRNGLIRLTAKRPGFNPASVYTLSKVIHYAIITVGILFGLSSIGLDISKFALLASALGVGIGFGLQNLVSNFVSGLILLFERSLKVGDFVELQSGVSGEVRQINIRSTLVTTNDNVDIVIPNSEFVNGRVTNWTMHEAARRVHIPFGVAYGTDKDLVRTIVVEAAKEVQFTLNQASREPQVWLVNFGDSSLDFELVIWLTQEGVKKPGLVSATYLWAIETALTQNGIEIPFPQRDVHIRSNVGLNPVNDRLPEQTAVPHNAKPNT